MKTSRLVIAAFASLVLFTYSCGNSNSSKEENVHSKSDGHIHAEIMREQKSSPKDFRNEKGELTDEAGNIIAGCPIHKEMIGSNQAMMTTIYNKSE